MSESLGKPRDDPGQGGGLPGRPNPGDIHREGPPPVPQPHGAGDLTSNAMMSSYPNNAYMNRYSMSPYGGLGMGGYNSFGSYGGYGSCSPYGMSSMYGGVGGGYGGGYGNPSDFSRLADESVRPAFQSVEHIVHAFSNISMMLESTYFALHNSFRAVIGVADHMSSVSTQLGDILASLSLVRTLRWIVARTLSVLGIRSETPEALWRNASEGQNSKSDPNEATSSSWPVIAFLSIVIGAPYLIIKMFKRTRQGDSLRWINGDAAHYEAVALYDFHGRNNTELSFKAGDIISLAPKEHQPRSASWLMGTVDGRNSGLIPVNYIKNLGLKEPSASMLSNLNMNIAVDESSSSSVSPTDFVKVDVVPEVVDDQAQTNVDPK